MNCRWAKRIASNSEILAGKPIVATNIASHTQVMDDTCAVLVDAAPQAMARGIERLAADEELGNRLGAAAESLVKRKYSMEVFRRTITEEYSYLEGGE